MKSLVVETRVDIKKRVVDSNSSTIELGSQLSTNLTLVKGPRYPCRCRDTRSSFPSRGPWRTGPGPQMQYSFSSQKHSSTQSNDPTHLLWSSILAPSSFLLPVVWPGAPSSVLAPSSDALAPVASGSQ